jgi:hypothetical protein
MDTLPLEKITQDSNIQQRSGGINQPRVREYAGAIRRGDLFPPVIVYHDGEHYWLADGFHRCQAAQMADRLEVDVEIRPGTQRDALLYATGANATHGLRRTNADKRKAVMTLLQDNEWSQWSDHEIARKTYTTQPFVSKLRHYISKETKKVLQTTIEQDNTGPALPLAVTLPSIPPLQRLNNAWKDSNDQEKIQWLEEHNAEIQSLQKKNDKS